MTRPENAASLAGWLWLAAALYVLNLSLSFHNVWPTLMVTDRHDLSIEVTVLLLGLALVAELRGVPARRRIGGLATLLLVLVLGRYAEVTAPALFGRAINLYWDARYLPAVAAMLGRVATPWQVALGVVGLVAVLALLHALLRLCLGRVWWALENPVPRRALAVVTGVLTLAYVSVWFGIPARPVGVYALPVTATYAEQARFLAQALAGDAVADSLPDSPAVASDLARVRDTDVFLVFVESYGAITYDRPEIAAVVAPARETLAAAVRDTGRTVVSAFVEAPTFGGGSWLSHASLMAGVEVREQGRYELLLTQQRETLARRFQAAGHRAVALMPGLRNAWPEGAFHGFETIHDADALAYGGPEFGWWRIPDQFALARFEQVEVAATERRPLFVFFPTISSHMPFRPLAPYQPDWARLLGPEPWDADLAAAAIAREPEWTHLGPSYAESIAYAQQWLAGWLRQPRPRPLLAIVVGDHQPPAAVSGQDATWEVPVHIVTHDPHIEQALLAAGFERGLQPGHPARLRMHELHALLLRVLDGATPDS